MLLKTVLKNISYKLLPLFLPILLIAFWAWGSHFEIFNTYIIPSPQKVLSTFVQLLTNGELFKHLLASLFRVVSGVLSSFILATLCCILFLLCPIFQSLMSGSLNFIRQIPPLAMLSILILFLGIGETPKVAIVAIASFFPMFVNFSTGISSCDPKLIEVGKVSQMSEWQIFKNIILPSALPSILTGISLALSYGWRSLVGAELVAASSGVGYMIMEARELAKSSVIFVGIITLGIMGSIMDQIFLLLFKHYVPYMHQFGKKNVLS
ncbi:MAG: ABC transporter permease [Spirochaetia bacterium]